MGYSLPKNPTKKAQDSAKATAASKQLIAGGTIDNLVRGVYGGPAAPVDPRIVGLQQQLADIDAGKMGRSTTLNNQMKEGINKQIAGLQQFYPSQDAGNDVTAPIMGQGTGGADGMDPNDPMLGGMNPDQSGQIGRNQRSILNEADLQKKLATETLTGQGVQRKQQLSDLADLLNKSQQQQMSAQLPGVYEDLNSKGLLRSSALGNNLATQQANLAAQTSNQLAQQGLAYNDQAINGETGIQNAYLGQRTGALQRGFSLEDYANQLKAAKLLGSTSIPNVAPSGPSGKGGGALQGALGGAQAGAMTGNPYGAAIGAGVGLLGGGALGGK